MKLYNGIKIEILSYDVDVILASNSEPTGSDFLPGDDGLDDIF